MTFNFHDWAFQRPHRTRSTAPSLFYPLVRRPTLVAHWHRGADGKLECRWERLSD